MAREDSLPVEFYGVVALLGLAGAGLAVVAATRRETARHRFPPDAPLESFTENDVEALARMFASENPRASRQLHIEQAWTEIRSRRRGQSLFDRITAGSGFGHQAEQKNGGGVRPVSTEEPATEKFRALAREILSGLAESKLPGAKMFFEPDQQDKAFAIGKRGREKLSRGEPLTRQEKRLIRYESDAAGLRLRWLAKGHEYIGSLEGLEFYS